MLRWGDLDPRRFERGVQGLLRSQNTGMVSIGSGGDGGADALWRAADGRSVFEMKSFTRLTAKRRAKVAGSLSTAVKTVPDMVAWVLVLPCNPTRAEQDWFENDLQKVAPEVKLEWRGIDWLDVQAAENPAFTRYVQGADNQLLKGGV